MRGVVLLVFILLLPPLVGAETNSQTVNLELYRTLGEHDLGIKTGAVSPDGKDVLLVGQEGFVMLIDAENPQQKQYDKILDPNRNVTIQSVDWHPRGNTALIMGDEGIAMRYDSAYMSLTHLNGSTAIYGLDMTTVSWRTGGDFAYFGAVDGSVWKFAEFYGFEPLNNTLSSEITDISCHRSNNICFASTIADGIAVITQDHEVAWLGGTNQESWIGIDCADPTLNECVAFGSGLKTKVLKINLLEAKNSYAQETMMLTDVVGDMSAVTRGHDSTSIAYLAPFGLIRNNPLDNEAFSMIQSNDVGEWDLAISGKAVKFVWEESTNNGFIITDFGHVIEFTPFREEPKAGIMEFLVFTAVAISVPGVILGLIYMNSPFLQKKYSQLRKWKRTKKTSK